VKALGAPRWLIVAFLLLAAVTLLAMLRQAERADGPMVDEGPSASSLTQPEARGAEAQAGGGAKPQRRPVEARELGGAVERAAASSVGAPTDPVAALKSALALADAQVSSGGDALEARRLLAQILRRRPALALSLAGSLGELENRGLAFQVGRLLGGYLTLPGMREALLEQLRSGPALAKEMTLYALHGGRDDPEAAGLSVELLEAPEGGPELRAAAASYLVEGRAALSAPERARLADRSAQLIVRSDLSEAVRSELVSLVDARPGGAGRPLLRELLSERSTAPPSLRLAAARGLLAAGEPAAPVLAELERLAASGALPASAAKALAAQLAEQRADGSRR
jgi:hypothetical protein